MGLLSSGRRRKRKGSGFICLSENLISMISSCPTQLKSCQMVPRPSPAIITVRVFGRAKGKPKRTVLPRSGKSSFHMFCKGYALWVSHSANTNTLINRRLGAFYPSVVLRWLLGDCVREQRKFGVPVLQQITEEDQSKQYLMPLWLCSYTGAVLETRCPFVRIFVQKEKRVSHLADALGRRSVGTICVCIVSQTKAVQAPGVPWADHGKTEMTT